MFKNLLLIVKVAIRTLNILFGLFCTQIYSTKEFEIFSSIAFAFKCFNALINYITHAIRIDREGGDYKENHVCSLNYVGLPSSLSLEIIASSLCDAAIYILNSTLNVDC